MYTKLIVSLTLTAAMVFAGSPWRDKKSDDWSEKDVAKILSDSPWAKTIVTVGPGPVSGQRGLAMGGGTSGTGLIGGSFPEGPKVTVRWESAQPAMEAHTGTKYELLPKLQQWVRDYYVVIAAGMPVLDALGEAPSPAPTADKVTDGKVAKSEIKAPLEGMIKATTLKRKGKDPVAPSRMEIVRIEDDMVPVFLFPRTCGITDEDKDVVFESAVGGIKVKAKFEVKDMYYEGKLSL